MNHRGAMTDTVPSTGYRAVALCRPEGRRWIKVGGETDGVDDRRRLGSKEGDLKEASYLPWTGKQSERGPSAVVLSAWTIPSIHPGRRPGCMIPICIDGQWPKP